MRYVFPEGNTIIYGQDMSFWEGVPANVVFTMDESFQHSNLVLLRARGHGETGNYGNGAIAVARKNLPAPLPESTIPCFGSGGGKVLCIAVCNALTQFACEQEYLRQWDSAR